MIELDFKIDWRDERAKYINQHLNPDVQLSAQELSTIADYILWGKDRQTGLNGLQEGIDLNSKWNTEASKLESLNALVESPTFNENSLRRLTDPPIKVAREVFSRSKTRKNAPAHLIADFEALWRQIDETEFIVQTYELAHGKRKTPLREELQNRFTEAERQLLAQKAQNLSSYHFLKLKRELVDLRTQQYILKDSYSSQILSNPTPSFEISEPPSFGDEITLRPLNLIQDPKLFKKVWRTDRFPEPSDFSEAELQCLSRHLWESSAHDFYFDFSNRDHLYTFFNIYDQLENAADTSSNFGLFKEILNSYIELAHLEPIHKMILNLKIKKQSNQLIADKIQRQFGRKYSPNYISTLYCAKSLQGICDAASLHRQIVENLMFPENFKTCKDCGRVLLLNETNFVRRQRSNDGFSPRCKACEKLKRKGGKQK